MTVHDSEPGRRRVNAALRQATQALREARAPAGQWLGELSSSALSTATAVTALAVVARASPSAALNSPIEAGLGWLARHVNRDGGWGDTPASFSNLSTTTLVWAAFGAVPNLAERHAAVIAQAERWLAEKIGVPADTLRTSTAALAKAVIARYGKDRTFSVPILTLCALAGRLGEGPAAWEHVLPLPFELAACPPAWFAVLRLPVVSYALPALIAIGQARHHHRPSRNPLARLLRQLTRVYTLRVLEDIQPANGGFLEATPLTSFVTLSLAGSGQANHPVVQRGLSFLRAAQRPDGSWPIDTNLATWLTTLAVNALGEEAGLKSAGRDPISAAGGPLRSWLLGQQYRAEHPYTHAAPGGWAWTDLPGGVPDADDTAGALLALRQLGPLDPAGCAAGRAGVQWLLDLQNADGGVPTFCRGWGRLPFDRSSADITAHALRAWAAWWDEVSESLRAPIRSAVRRAARFLEKTQRPDGSWVPLWFGNQFAPTEENPTYGTARVVTALARTSTRPALVPPAVAALTNGVRWLLEAQNRDGSWGGFIQGPASVEETALAVEALASVLSRAPLPCTLRREAVTAALARGTEWLVARVENGTWTQPSPIGFYFAALWYSERLYPMIFTVGALRAAAALPP